MSTEVRDSFQGIVTNIAEPKAPGYALRIADNVVMRRAGALELRQGFTTKFLGYAKTAITFLGSQNHGTTTVFETSGGWRASAGGVRQYVPWGSAGAQSVTKFRADQFSSALQRGNHYLPHARGTVAASSAADTSWRPAGQMLAGSAASIQLNAVAAAGRGLPDGYQWAYRIVLRRTDANGYVLRSIPSGVVFVQNATGSAYSVSITPIAEISWAGSADTIELYRSRAFPNTVQFDDEMALVAEQTVTGSIVEIVDDVPDALRGAALYTSPSREGLENQKDCPPAAFCVESYRGCMFYLNTVGPQRFVFSHNWADQTGNASGVGFRTATCTIATGNATISAVSNTTGLQIGMLAQNPAGTIRGYITAIAGSSITLSAPATATGALQAVSFMDSVQINGAWHALGPASATKAMTFPDYLMRADNSGGASVDFLAYELSPALSGFQHTFVVESKTRNATAFTIRATHGDSFTPPLPLNGVSPASTSAMDSYPNALQWSQPDEPEAVAPGNYALIAEKTKWGLGLAATRDSLFIFKEDGIWRLSGYAGQWQIDPFDMTTFCILPSSIQKLNNRVLMLSNRGLVAISELGTEVLSFKIDDQMKYVVDDVRANFASLGYYKISGVDGCASAVDDRNNEYLLHVGTVAHDLGPGQLFVYNERSQAWTTMSFGAGGGEGFSVKGLGIAENHAPLLLGAALVHQADYTVETTLGTTSRRAYDGSIRSVTILTALDNGDDTATLTVSPSSFSVAGYDILNDVSSDVDYEIVQVPAADTVVVRLNGADLPTNSANVFRAYPVTVQLHGFLNTPVLGKAWNSCVVGFSRLVGATSLGVTFSSAEPTVAEPSQLLTQAYEDLRRSLGMAAHHLGTLARVDIPIDHVRAWLLRMKVSWLMRRGVVSMDMVGMDARETDSNSPNQNSSGLS